MSFGGTTRSAGLWSVFSPRGTTFGDLLNDPEEVKDGLLIAENVTYLRGRDGLEVEARSAWLVTIRQGQQTSLTLYQTKQEALEAVGLRE